jgi:hypothetical protein
MLKSDISDSSGLYQNLAGLRNLTKPGFEKTRSLSDCNGNDRLGSITAKLVVPAINSLLAYDLPVPVAPITAPRSPGFKRISEMLILSFTQIAYYIPA